MPKTAKKKNYYFTKETEDAIVAYNLSTNSAERNKIYKDHIAYPFDKLCENIIHTFKFYYFDVPSIDVKYEVISFLLSHIDKYDPSKGKAFSYFSIVAKNYLIMNNNKNYKMNKLHSELDQLEYSRNVLNDIVHSEYNEKMTGFLDELIKFWDINLNKIFFKKNDIVIADAIIQLFKSIENIENFNKKALYILVREMTGFNTQQITRVVNQMKLYNNRLLYEFEKYGQINMEYTGSMLMN